MGAADLDDVGEGLRLLARAPSCRWRERRQQAAVDLARRRDVHGGRKRIVRRLAQIDVVVRMDRRLSRRACRRARSLARFASTSFMFMLDCVPEPVCQTTSGNSSSSLPCTTSCAARAMASARRGSRSAELLVHEGGGLLDERRARGRAASACARRRCGNSASERCVCAPQSRSAGHLDRAEGIGFGAGLSRHPGLFCGGT